MSRLFFQMKQIVRDSPWALAAFSCASVVVFATLWLWDTNPHRSRERSFDRPVTIVLRADMDHVAAQALLTSWSAMKGVRRAELFSPAQSRERLLESVKFRSMSLNTQDIKSLPDSAFPSSIELWIDQKCSPAAIGSLRNAFESSDGVEHVAMGPLIAAQNINKTKKDPTNWIAVVAGALLALCSMTIRPSQSTKQVMRVITGSMSSVVAESLLIFFAMSLAVSLVIIAMGHFLQLDWFSRATLVCWMTAWIFAVGASMVRSGKREMV